MSSAVYGSFALPSGDLANAQNRVMESMAERMEEDEWLDFFKIFHNE